MRPEGVEEEHDVDQRKGIQKKRKQHLPNLGHLPLFTTLPPISARFPETGGK